METENELVVDLFKVRDKESMDDLFKEAFRDLEQCQRSLDAMRAAKASSPANKEFSRGLVSQQEGGVVVRIHRKKDHQACFHFIPQRNSSPLVAGCWFPNVEHGRVYL